MVDNVREKNAADHENAEERTKKERMHGVFHVRARRNHDDKSVHRRSSIRRVVEINSVSLSSFSGNWTRDGKILQLLS